MLIRRTLVPALAALAALTLAASPALAKKKDPKPTPTAAPAPDPKALNSLTVACSTTNADVYVDNENIGKAPIDLPVPVSNGSHAIRVVKLGFAPYIDVFRAVPGKPVKLDIELTPISGVLHVKASHPQSRVLVDGKYVGDAPVDVEMEPGKRVVQVTKAGFYEWKREVTSVSGQDVEFEVTLKELPPELNPYVIKTPPPLKWYQKKWVWGVVAGVAVVAAGGATAGALIATRDPLGGADVTYNVGNPAALTVFSF